MMGGLALLVLLRTLYPIEAAEVPGRVSLIEAQLGANVTFHCPVSETENNIFHWYKQPLGCAIQTVATIVLTKPTLGPEFNNSRFRVTAGETQHSLTIMNISKEDEATYFCLIGSSYSPRFGDVTFLAVKDGRLQKSFHVEQSPEAESVLLGDSVTLQCSLVSRDKDKCPHGLSVFWFRSGSAGSHPGFIHTQETQPGDTSCVYRLSKRIQSSSDVGTYHCAVASCGEILFGGGTKVETQGFRYFVDRVFLLPLCAVVVLSLNATAVLIYVIKKKKCDCGSNEAAASLLENVAKRTFKRNEDARTYSTVVFSVMKSGGRRRAEGAQRSSHAAVEGSG